MQNLPIDIFNGLRGFLKFEELHKMRRVSKRWNEIRRVEKRVTYRNSKTVPLTANFQNIVSLRFYDYASEQHDPAAQILKKIFIESSNTIQDLHLTIMFVPDFPECFPLVSKLGCSGANVLLKSIPLCPNIRILFVNLDHFGSTPTFPMVPTLDDLIIDGDSINGEELTNLLQYFPNIKSLDVGNMEISEVITIDLALCSNVQTLSFFKASALFENPEAATSLKSIQFEGCRNRDEHSYEILKQYTVKWIKAFPKARISFFVSRYDKENDDMLLLETENFDLRFKKILSDTIAIDFAGEIKKALVLLFSIRKFRCKISPEMNEQDACALLLLLAKTGLFDRGQLKEFL